MLNDVRPDHPDDILISQDISRCENTRLYQAISLIPNFGATIVDALLSEDQEGLVITLDNDQEIRITGQQSCCEQRYMHTEDNLSSLRGQKFMGIRIKKAAHPLSLELGPLQRANTDEENSSLMVQFLEIATDGAGLAFAHYNQNNGYYSQMELDVHSRRAGTQNVELPSSEKALSTLQMMPNLYHNGLIGPSVMAYIAPAIATKFIFSEELVSLGNGGNISCHMKDSGADRKCELTVGAPNQSQIIMIERAGFSLFAKGRFSPTQFYFTKNMDPVLDILGLEEAANAVRQARSGPHLETEPTSRAQPDRLRP